MDFDSLNLPTHVDVGPMDLFPQDDLFITQQPEHNSLLLPLDEMPMPMPSYPAKQENNRIFWQKNSHIHALKQVQPELPSLVPAVKVERKTQRKKKSIPNAGKILKKPVTPAEKEEHRRMKHRLIDRARRRREKRSVEELKELVFLEANERPDKATVVSAAVKTIRILKAEVARLQGEKNAQRMPNLETVTPPMSPVSDSSDFSQGSAPSVNSNNITTATLLKGAADAGVASMMIDIKTGAVTNVNERFESITGFKSSQLVGSTFETSPLYGRHMIDFGNKGVPQEALLEAGLKKLRSGQSWKVVTVHATSKDNMSVQSINTMFLLRDQRGVPFAIMNINTPDQRRLVRTPDLPDAKGARSIFPQLIRSL